MQKRAVWRNVGITVASVVLVLLLGLRIRLAPTAWVAEGPSMIPALQPEDAFVTVSGTLARGDIVVLRSPVDAIYVIKRVIGLAGDRVTVVDGVARVNGRSLEVRRGHARDDAHAWFATDGVCVEERSGDARWWVAFVDSGAWPPLEETTVPEGHVYVLGDFRDHSNDSRFIGPIPSSAIRGLLWFRYRSHPGATCVP